MYIYKYFTENMVSISENKYEILGGGEWLAAEKDLPENVMFKLSPKVWVDVG